MTIHQPDSPRKADARNRRRDLKQLAETYAIRTREFADAVATLGMNIVSGQQFHDNIQEVERMRVLSEQAHEDLLSAIAPKEAVACAASGCEISTQPGNASANETTAPLGNNIIVFGANGLRRRLRSRSESRSVSGQQCIVSQAK